MIPQPRASCALVSTNGVGAGAGGTPVSPIIAARGLIGEVLLVKEKDAWQVDNELMELGLR